MPNWKKVITSGSNAILNDITASRLTLESSGSTIFDVVGSQGQLFSITDSLSGSLFAVSDISGLPILEVFSNDTVKIGSFNDEAITVSGSHTTIGGVLAIPGFTDVSASLAAAGVAGSSGTSGTSGSSGTSGATGGAGNDGSSGTSGTSGSSGTSGTSGSSGTSGTSGSSGTSGTSGSSGTSGTSGSSGTSGTSGSSGSSGTSGTSGSSGTSGTSPTIANDANNRIVTAVGDGTLNAESTLTYNGSTFELQANAFNIQSSTFNFNGVPAGTDNTVLILNSSDDIVTDEIDSRVWGTSLIDSSGFTMVGDIDMDGQTLDMNGGQIDNGLQISSATFMLGNGSAGNPSLSFTADTNTGIYLAGPDSMLLQAGGGTAELLINTSGITVNNGNLQVNATANINTINIDDTNNNGAVNSAGEYGYGSETVTFYSDTVIAGYVYYLGASSWASSDADAVSTSKGFMGVATSTNSNTGMVIRGIVYLGADPGGSVGDVVYLATATGRLTTDISGFTTGDVARIMGYKVGTSLVFFNPSPDWIQID